MMNLHSSNEWSYVGMQRRAPSAWGHGISSPSDKIYSLHDDPDLKAWPRATAITESVSKAEYILEEIDERYKGVPEKAG